MALIANQTEQNTHEVKANSALSIENNIMNASKTGQVFQTIDARGWQPPEPMVRALEALELLPCGQKLVMLILCEPRPLFRVLKNNGFDYRFKFVPEGYYEVAMWHVEDTLATSAGLE